MTGVAEAGASWSQIFTKQYASKIATLVLAVWLHASNSMLTATTMPSAVEEIGGLNLLHWTFALYLVGSIIAGARWWRPDGAGLYIAGSIFSESFRSQNRGLYVAHLDAGSFFRTDDRCPTHGFLAVCRFCADCACG